MESFSEKLRKMKSTKVNKKHTEAVFGKMTDTLLKILLNLIYKGKLIVIQMYLTLKKQFCQINKNIWLVFS